MDYIHCGQYGSWSMHCKFLTGRLMTLQIVNFGSDTVNLKIAVNGLDLNTVRLSGSTKTVFTSSNLMDENSFNEPTKVLD